MSRRDIERAVLGAEQYWEAERPRVMGPGVRESDLGGTAILGDALSAAEESGEVASKPGRSVRYTSTDEDWDVQFDV